MQNVGAICLTSRAFGTATVDFRKIFAQLIKKLCVEELESTSFLESFLACRLIPLLFKSDVKHAADALQLKAGHDTGIEPVVHAMHHVVFEENTEVVLLIDAESAYNWINFLKAMLHNI